MEIPIIAEAMQDRKGATLEVGNVLSQYIGRHKWVTVDLMEKEDGVVNANILDYTVPEPFNLIVSISTFEHIGVDDCGDRFRAIDAVRHCASLLASKGCLLFTVPVGYNPVLDAWLLHRWPGETRCLLRVSRDNKWVEVSKEVAQQAKYGFPFDYANALLVGQFTAKGCLYQKQETTKEATKETTKETVNYPALKGGVSVPEIL